MKKPIIFFVLTLICTIIVCGAASAVDNTSSNDVNANSNITNSSSTSTSSTTLTTSTDTSNLVISNFQVPNNTNLGQTYPVTVTVSNSGSANADSFPVYLWENNTLINQQTVPNLAAGQNIDVMFNWIPTSTGTTNLQTGLNLNDLITETILYDGGNDSTQFTYSPTASNSVEYNGLWNLTNRTIISTVMWDAVITSSGYPNNMTDEYDVEIYNGTKYASWRYLQQSMAAGIWWDIGLSRNDSVYHNGFTDADFANITKIKIYFSTPTTGTKTAHIKEVKIRDIINSNGYVTFRFDDGTVSQYTNAYTMMQAYGYKGSIFPIIDGVDKTGRVTVEELNTLYNNGWDVGSHTISHQDPQDISLEKMIYELSASKQWLLDHGYTRSADLFVAPDFALTPTYYDLIKQYYKMCGVGNYYSPDSDALGSILFPAPNFFQVQTSYISPNNYRGATDFPAALNTVAKNGEWIVILIHNVSTSDEIAYFNNLLQAVQASGVQVKTFSEMYALINRLPTKQVTVTAPKQPDLIVSNLQLPSNPLIDITYPITITIMNNGALDAGSFEISLSDGSSNLGTQPIDSLEAGQNTTITINWTPTTTGTHTLTAIADNNNQINENNENNNTQTQQTNVTQNQPDLPDLTISNLQIPSNPTVGTTYPINITITNNGTATSSSTNKLPLHVADGLEDGDVSHVTQSWDGMVQANNTNPMKGNYCIQLNSSAGNWFALNSGDLIPVKDGDNWILSMYVRTQSGTGDHLQMQILYYDSTKTLVGYTTAYSCTGLNTSYQRFYTSGNCHVGWTTVTYIGFLIGATSDSAPVYLIDEIQLEPATTDTGSFQTSLLDGTTTIGTQTINSLAAGQSVSLTINWTPTTTGTHTLTATADNNNQINETNETNNKQTQQTNVTQNLPDLTITNLQTPTSAKTGTTYPITVTVTNNGSTNVGSFLVYFYENNRRVGSKTVTSLAAGQSSDLIFNWVPTSKGVRTLQIRVDPTNLISESKENNNVQTKQITVT